MNGTDGTHLPAQFGFPEKDIEASGGKRAALPGAEVPGRKCTAERPESCI